MAGPASMGNHGSSTADVNGKRMFELVPYVVYILFAAILSRSIVVLVARCQSQKTPGEEALAKLPILPYRDVDVQVSTIQACYLAMRNGGVWRPAGALALLHVSLWVALAGVFLLMAIVEIANFDWTHA